MENSGIFQTALTNFATDVACGGAIRHLTDIGCTLDQIVERLDYPTPRAKAQKIMMAYLYEEKVLVKEEPSMALFQKPAAYGRERSVSWKEISFRPQRGEKLKALLYQKCEENGEVYSFVSCPFQLFQDSACLNRRQKEYLAGLCLDTPVIYHRLNGRMQEIIAKLYEAGEYNGVCYFLQTEEKLLL